MGGWAVERILHFGPGGFVVAGLAHFGFHLRDGRYVAIEHQRYFLDLVGDDGQVQQPRLRPRTAQRADRPA